MQNGTAVMIEREEPKFVSFATGDVVEGVLLNIERIKVKDKPAIRYTVRLDDKTFASFVGTHHLNTKLRVDDIGHYVSITCQGEDTMVKRGDNCMKVFRVLVSENPVASRAAITTDGTEITDDDNGRRLTPVPAHARRSSTIS